MIRFLGSARAGKTHQLVCFAKQGNFLIITHTRDAADCIKREYGYPNVMSVEQFMRGNHSGVDKYRGFVVDNIELCVPRLLGVNIDGFTMTI